MINFRLKIVNKKTSTKIKYNFITVTKSIVYIPRKGETLYFLEIWFKMPKNKLLKKKILKHLVMYVEHCCKNCFWRCHLHNSVEDLYSAKTSMWRWDFSQVWERVCTRGLMRIMSSLIRISWSICVITELPNELRSERVNEFNFQSDWERELNSLHSEIHETWPLIGTSHFKLRSIRRISLRRILYYFGGFEAFRVVLRELHDTH